MNKKIGTVALIVLMAVAFAVIPTQVAFGQNSQLGIQILQIIPAGSTISNGTSTLTGPVGMALNIEGTIYTSNGNYQVLFNGQTVASGQADGYLVDTNLTVPAVATGSYAVRIRDVTYNANSTEEDFQVTTSYFINAVSSYLQEGGATMLNVTVTAATAGVPYFANVSVALPSPLNTQYSEAVSLGTASQTGTVSAQVTFPNSSFQPNGNSSLAVYTGTYIAYFNQTDDLAQTQFSVGFLDSSTYHRGQTASIEATGYQPGEIATLSVITPAGSSLNTQSLTADSLGNINGTLQIPSNIAIGTYNATLTPQGTQKAILDAESFSISGYAIQVETVNLAGEEVSGITIQALDTVTGTTYSSISGTDGVAPINLETGNVGLTASLSGVNVGQSNITVSGGATFKMTCQLTDLKIAVQNQNSVPVPFVTLSVTFQYQQTNGTSQTGNVTGQTNAQGIFTYDSTLVGISYNIAASLYGQVFNSGNSTVSSLPAEGVNQVMIICPSEALTLSVLDSNKVAISDARIDLVELTTGLFYTATTDHSGSAIVTVTFGDYSVQVYDSDNIMINQTNIQAFANSQQQITCTLYGIKVSVSVVDFFGNPIQNANVTLNGPATERFSINTNDDGTAVFNNVVGGDMQIVAFAPGAQKDYQAVTLTVDQPTSVQMKIDKFVTLGSLILPVSLLIAIITIVVAIVLFVVLELFWRRISKR